MTTDEREFLSELDIFRRECEGASQFLYAYLAIHQVAKRRKAVFRALDRNALLWNTVAGALQASAILTLGRVFDQSTPHNLDILLGKAQRSRSIFLKHALAKRKEENSPSAPLWLPQFMAGVEEPSVEDFRTLRKHVAKFRRVYERRYQELRHKVVAHTVAAGSREVAPIAAKANINELKKLIASLLSLHHALQEAFWNGHRLVLPKISYSAKPKKGLTQQSRPHERIVAEVEAVLIALASNQSAGRRSRIGRG